MNPSIVFSAVALLLLAGAASAQFGDWGVPANVGSPANSLYLDSCTSISKNGLSLYFASTRPGGFGGGDIYVVTRDKLRH